MTSSAKRDDSRWEVPTKYGFRDCHTITDSNAGSFELLEQYHARQKYGFSVNTDPGIIADRVQDDGDERTAQLIRGKTA